MLTRTLDRNSLLVYHDEHGQPKPVKSVRDWQERRAEIMKGMESVMGLLRGRAGCCALDMRVETEEDCGTHTFAKQSHIAQNQGHAFRPGC